MGGVSTLISPESLAFGTVKGCRPSAHLRCPLTVELSLFLFATWVHSIYLPVLV